MDGIFRCVFYSSIEARWTEVKIKLPVFLNRQIEKIQRSSFVSKLLKNAAVSFIGEGGAAFFSLINTILLIRFIGKKDYGILTVAYTFITIVDAFVNFQSWQTVIAFGSKMIERKDYEGLERVIKIGSLIDAVTAVLGMLVCFATAGFFTNLLNWTAETQQCIYILCIMVLFNFTGTSIGIVRLLDRFKYYSIYRIVTEAVRLALVILICGIMKKGLFGAAVAFTIAYVFGYLLFSFMFLNLVRKDKRLSLHRMLHSKIKGKWKEFLSFTAWTNFASSADIPVQQFDIMFLSMLSYEVVTVFKVYKQIVGIMNKLMLPIKQAIMPLFSEMVAKKEYAKSYDYLIKMKNKSFKILIPAVLVITALSLVFMYIVLDATYVEYWYILLCYMLIRTFALAWAAIHPLFIALGEVKKEFYFTLIANIAYTLIVYLTIRLIGIWAILLGLLVEYVILIYLKKFSIQKVIANCSQQNEEGV